LRDFTLQKSAKEIARPSERQVGLLGCWIFVTHNLDVHIEEAMPEIQAPKQSDGRVVFRDDIGSDNVTVLRDPLAHSDC